MVRVGFAGAGFIAGIHAEVLTQHRDVRIVGVTDPDGERAQAFAEKTGAAVLPSTDDLIDAVDVLYVCTPNALHAPLAIAALEAGRHVFSEKPPAISLDEARRLETAVGRSDHVYQIGFNKRFAPVYRTLKERIEAGDLVPRWAHSKMNRGDLQRPAWVADPTLSGGFLYETPIHLLDLFTWLFGPPIEAVCRAAQTCAAQLDDFAMVLTFASGVTTTFCSSAHTTWLFPFERVEVYGEHAAAVVEEMDRITLQLDLDGLPTTQDVHELPLTERWGYAAEDAAFLAAVRGEAPPPVGVREAVQAVEFVDACYRAAATGAPVRLDTSGGEG